MKFEIFINFNGNCREAVEFYAKVFKSEVKDLMTVSQAPLPNYKPKESEKDLIMYAEVKIGDKNVMFMDMTEEYHVTIGNNITPTINVQDKDEINRLFDALKVDGKVHMEPQKTFYSDWYAMVEDKFGIVWQLLGPMPQE